MGAMGNHSNYDELWPDLSKSCGLPPLCKAQSYDAPVSRETRSALSTVHSWAALVPLYFPL